MLVAKAGGRRPFQWQSWKGDGEARSISDPQPPFPFHRWATGIMRGQAACADNSVGPPSPGRMLGPCGGWAEARGGQRWGLGWVCHVVTASVDSRA